MRRLSGDRGAVAVLTAILAVVLFGFGAMVIDVSQLYFERRELQNGADASALAVAGRCAVDNCVGLSGSDVRGEAQHYGDGAALDDAENLELCGDIAALGGGCSPSVGGLPAGTKGYVRSDARTGSSAGRALVPPVLAKVLDDSYDGTTVRASALAIWGIPSTLRTLPLTISRCEFNAVTQNRTDFAPAPPYASGNAYPPNSYDETVIFFKRPVDSNWPTPVDLTDPTCVGLYDVGPGHDGPGAFGWLPTDNNECQVTVGATDTVSTNTGADVPQDCRTGLEPWLGKVVGIPIYKSAAGTGSNLSYTIDGFAAFLLTGWDLRNVEQKSIVPPHKLCTTAAPADWTASGSSMDCISGYFVSGVVPGRGTVGGTVDLGARTIQLFR